MNVLLITVDALRPDHLGCYGYDRPTTPFLDTLSKDAVRFENALSNGPGTTFAFKPIFTSRYPQAFPEVFGLQSEVGASLAEVMDSQGYQTAGFHSNGHLVATKGYDRGFDEYWGPSTWPSATSPKRKIKHQLKEKIKQTPWLNSAAKRLYDQFVSSPVGPQEYARSYKTAAETNEAAISWYEDIDTDRDFFLWVHYMDVHDPYKLREEYISKVCDNTISTDSYQQARTPTRLFGDDNGPTEGELDNVLSLYDSEIRYTDEHIQELVETVADDDTLIVFTADHGEPFGEVHGEFHILSPHWNMTDVPLLISGPGIESDTVSQHVSHLDIAPTICELTGSEAPSSFRGHNVFSEANREPIYINYLTHTDREPGYACVSDGWKYIYETSLNDEQLYDITADPHEKHDCAAEQEDILVTLREYVEDHIKENNGGLGEIDYSTVEGQTRDNLENLGYID